MQTGSSSSPTAESTAPSTTPTRTRLQSASPTSETDMLRLAILTARKRLGTYVGAFLALFGSAVLVMAGGMLLQSALRNHPPVTRYAAADAVVTGHQDVGPDHDVILGEPVRISSTLVRRLAAVPGVRAAIADDAVPGRLGSQDVQGHGWSSAQLAPYRLVAGRSPATANEVVTTFPSRIGARERLTTTEKARTVTVVGIAQAPSTAHGAPLVFLTDSEAARLAGHPGRVDAIGILGRPGLDVGRVRAAAPDAAVLTGSARGNAESPSVQIGRTQLIAVAASFGGLGMFIAIFIVAGTMALIIQQREHEIALLRAVAATPGQVRRMIAWEATIVSLVASAAGVLPRAAPREAPSRGVLPPRGAAPPHPPSARLPPATGAIASGVTIALLAVLAAARRASRIAPTRALADAAVH